MSNPLQTPFGEDHYWDKAHHNQRQNKWLIGCG